MTEQKFKKLDQSTNEVLQYLIHDKMALLPFLREVLPHRSRNSVKSILSRGQVSIDNQVITQFNYPLKRGQVVEILKNKAAKRQSHFDGINILYEDNDIIVIEKEAGLLSIATKKEKSLTAYKQVMDYVRNKNRKNRVYIVHRLDKDTSGVMMFAKSEDIKNKLQSNWNRLVKERLYVALVEGDVNQEKGTITSWLKETKTHVVYSTNDRKGGLHAITHYKKLQTNRLYTLVEVRLETGRKNQIRVHMNDINHPVVGDKKYGSKKNPIRRLGLHAKSLTFIHPRTEKQMCVTSKVPEQFHQASK